ncbi:MAG: hypothetical protein H6835_20205 [Planctomycetes bacterium]|nr:hypothetical protein [Planctomycetota bacterium]
MGHIVFASPPIERFPLLMRLRRELLRRNHRVTLLATDPIGATFWRHQVGEVVAPASAAPDAAAGAHAAIVAARHGLGARQLARLRRQSAGLHRWLTVEPPDLVLFHDRRSPANACLQQAAIDVGARVLWSGDGLLPGTLQIDDVGVDGDASCRRWTAADFRVVTPERALLDACVAHALAAPAPFELPPPEVVVPAMPARLRDFAALLAGGEPRLAIDSLRGWRRAQRVPTAEPELAGPAAPAAGHGPSFVVLLQRDDDPALRLDADAPPTAEALVRRAAAAVRGIDVGARIAVVTDRPDRAALRRRCADLAGVTFVPFAAARVWLATAAGVVTVNHRLAGLATACGTPVVHLGRGLFDVAGVSTPTTVEALPQGLERALRRDHRALRRRVLTWLLRHGHVWCDADHPNHNGMLGLVQAVERRLAGQVTTRPLPYRAGPTWPLATS